MNEEHIILRPKFIYWILSSFKFVLLLGVILFATYYFIGYPYVRQIGFGASIVIILVLFYHYINILLCTRWVISDEEIRIYKGVFSRTINHIELYRIFDYEERKSFIHVIFGITNVFIHSGDKTSPTLAILGIKGNTDIVDQIRSRVEAQRQIKSIYEFTNR